MKAYKFFILVLLSIVISSCGSKKDNSYESVDQMISDAQSGVSKVTIDELTSILQHEGEYKIIDCREEEEYIEGHIPGAINIPRGVLEFSSKISDRRETLYVYSQSNNRASLACPALKLLKYRKVFLIDGGCLEWNKNFPELIEKGDGDAGAKTPAKVEESGGCG